jgi:hypothetical protein
MSKKSLVLSVCFLGAIWGCNKGPSVAAFPVTGTVTYEGKPVEGASVMFMSKNPDGPKANGETDAEGRFSLTTYLGPQQILKGAVPDEYKVAIIKAPPPETGGEMEPGLDPTTPAYQEKSIQRMVKMAGPIPGADKRANTGPVAPKKISLLPEKYANPATSGLKVTVVTGQNDPVEFKLSD